MSSAAISRLLQLLLCSLQLVRVCCHAQAKLQLACCRFGLVALLARSISKRAPPPPPTPTTPAPRRASSPPSFCLSATSFLPACPPACPSLFVCLALANRYPDRCVAGRPLPVKVNDKDVVPDPLRARLIVHSLERGPAYRARAWMLPAPAPDAPDEGAVRASAVGQKRKNVISVRLLRVSDLRRNKAFVRAVRR